MCFPTFKWQIFANNTLRTLFNFPLFFFTDFLIFLLRMQSTLKIFFVIITIIIGIISIIILFYFFNHMSAC